MRIRLLALFLFGAVALHAQQPFERKTEVTPTQPLAGETQSLWGTYERAIFDSAVYQRWNVRPLRPLTPDANGNVLVVTLTSKDGEVGATLPVGTYGAWVTGVPEVQTICRAFHGDVAMQLRELLGLPPDADTTRFIVLTVAASDLFRPTPDDRISTTYPCTLNPDATLPSDCGNKFPDGTTAAHYQWMAIENFYLHSVPNGYPWTHLGYTYNWAPGADRYGASEYVIRPNAKAVIVSKATVPEYCKAPGAEN